MDTTATPATPTTPSHPPPVTIKEAHEGLSQHFRDFDDPEVYEKYLVDTVHRKSANFAVRFGADKARIAADLEPQDVTTLINLDLTHREQEDLPVTWM